RRATHAPLEVGVILQDVGGPLLLAGPRLQADELARSPQCVDLAALDGRCRARARTAHQLAEPRRVGVRPDLLPRWDVVADNRLPVVALLQGDGNGPAGDKCRSGKQGPQSRR